MKRALSCLLRPFRWLKRFRNRCGYGIHSPFAFQFVTGVIYEKGEYYAYDALENLYRQESNHELRLKDCKLLFRLANFAHAKTAYEALGEENTARTALKMGSQSSVFLEKPGPATLICLGTNFPPEKWNEMMDLLNPKACSSSHTSPHQNNEAAHGKNCSPTKKRKSLSTSQTSD